MFVNCLFTGISSSPVCSIVCLEDGNCASTLYDASLQECQLFSGCSLEINTLNDKTDIVYMKKHKTTNKYKGYCTQ